MDKKKYRKILCAEADWIYNQLSLSAQDSEELTDRGSNAVHRIR